MGHVGPCKLHKSAGMLAGSARHEQTDLIDRKIIIGSTVPQGDGFVGVGERTLHHDRQWNFRCQPLATALGVAANLEGAAEWRELRPKTADVAPGAGLPGLAGEIRDGEGNAAGPNHGSSCYQSESN